MYRQFLRCFHTDEEGATYSLSTVLVLPIFITVIAFVIELLLLLNSQQALNAATQNAVHTTRAWILQGDSLAEQETTLDQVVHRSVARNLAAFATTKISPTDPPDESIGRTLAAVNVSATSCERYARKYALIEKHLRVTITTVDSNPKALFVQLEYDTPIWFAPFRLLLGNSTKHGNQFRTLTTNFKVFAPQQDLQTRSMGLASSPWRAQHWPSR